MFSSRLFFFLGNQKQGTRQNCTKLLKLAWAVRWGRVPAAQTPKKPLGQELNICAFLQRAKATEVLMCLSPVSATTK